MISNVQIRDFRCIREVDVKLTPLHAFIGPNDSGKSTLLRAVAAMATSLTHSPKATFIATTASGAAYRYDNESRERTFHLAGQAMWVPAGANAVHPDIAAELSPVKMIRLDPDVLRQPSALIPDTSPLVMGERGEGLPGVVDALISRGDETWARLRGEFRKLFPFATLTLPRPNPNVKTLGVRLGDGTDVGPNEMSEGMLYFLAFLVLTEIQRPAVFLVEEPENGLHPSRIADVMGVLRAIAEDNMRPAQVLIATHSPLVINELRHDEVSVVTRDAAGTHVRPIAATPNFEKRSKVYSLGELWLSYANGTDESPLLEKGVAE